MENLLQNVWFGEKEEILVEEPNGEEKQLLQFLSMFKEGIFDNKKEFVELFTNSDSYEVYAVGMRIFLAICTHKDFELISEFLEECEEEKLRVFLAFVQESLSCQVVPYLIDLLEIWEETYVEKNIIRTICEIIRYDYHEEEGYDICEIKKAFEEFKKKNDISKYYYKGEVFHIGNLTQKMLIISMNCKANSKKYYATEISSLLSNCTGKKCPVINGTIIDESSISKIMMYIGEVAQLNQEKGEKYFYNHLIN